MINAPDKPDLLEAIQGNADADLAPFSTTNRLLLELIRETRKAHPSQRCVVDIQFSDARKILDDSTAVANLRFLAQGKPVLSQYLVVSNNTAVVLALGLNDPVSINAANTFAQGIRIPAGGTVQIPVEIETIQLRLVTAAAAQGITINNSGDVPVNGQIQVYAWTIPNSDKDDTE